MRDALLAAPFRVTQDDEQSIGLPRPDFRTISLGEYVTQRIKLVAPGLAIGVPTAFMLTRVMASLLFGISASDPMIPLRTQ